MPKLLLIICAVLGADCGKEPPIVPPPDDSFVTVERELTDGEQPAVSPDGRKIAYTYKGDIYVMDTSGTSIMQLTSGAEVDLMARWHPNGQTIGFIRTNSGEYNRGLIFSVPATGGAATQLIFNQFVADSLIDARYTAIGIPIWGWSPRGESVAFLQQHGNQTLLKVVNSLSGQEIYSNIIYDWSTAIVGNGSSFVWCTENEIAFIAQNSRRRMDLSLLNFTTNQLLTDSSHIDPIYLTKDPITKRFAYFSRDGIVVTNFSQTLGEYPLAGGGFGLRWSPDGKFFLFESPLYVPNPFGYRESRLGIFDLEREKEYLLTRKGDIDRSNHFFDWGKSSRMVYFERYKKINVVTFEFLMR